MSLRIIELPITGGMKLKEGEFFAAQTLAMMELDRYLAEGWTVMHSLDFEKQGSRRIVFVLYQANSAATPALQVVEETTKFQIKRLVRGTTKNSSSPMWRGVATDDTRINVFAHSDPAKNNFKLFEDAGYEFPLMSMGVDDAAEFDPPIPIEAKKKGEWWEVVKVLSGGEWKPEKENQPNAAKARTEAILWARDILNKHDAVIFDVETNSFDQTGEIVRLAVINMQGDLVLDQMIKPLSLERLNQHDPQRGMTPAQYHGITPEMLADAQPFTEAFVNIEDVLDSKTRVGWNVNFDEQQIIHDCRLHDQFMVTGKIQDAMAQYGAFAGEWNSVYGNWKWHKLADACRREGLPVLKEHDPVEDCRMTLALIKHMAAAIRCPD